MSCETFILFLAEGDAPSCLSQIPDEYTWPGWPHSVTVGDVIVEHLMLLWQLLITALVLWELSIQHGNNTTHTICQSLSAGDTFPGVWLSITMGSLAMLTCQPSSPYRLIPHKPDLTFTRSSSPPFSSPTFLQRRLKPATGLRIDTGAFLLEQQK